MVPANDRLLECVENKDEAGALAALADGADPNARKTLTLTADTGARGHTEVLEGESALFLAVLTGQAAIAEALLAAGAAPNRRVRWCVANGHPAWSEEDWQRRAYTVYAFDTALHAALGAGEVCACDGGSAPERQAALDDDGSVEVNPPGARVSLENPTERTGAPRTLLPSLPVVRLLLAHGAHVDELALAAAEASGDADVLAALQEYEALEDPPFEEPPPMPDFAAKGGEGAAIAATL